MSQAVSGAFQGDSEELPGVLGVFYIEGFRALKGVSEVFRRYPAFMRETFPKPPQKP